MPFFSLCSSSLGEADLTPWFWVCDPDPANPGISSAWPQFQGRYTFQPQPIPRFLSWSYPESQGLGGVGQYEKWFNNGLPSDPQGWRQSDSRAKWQRDSCPNNIVWDSTCSLAWVFQCAQLNKFSVLCINQVTGLCHLQPRVQTNIVPL